MSNFDAAAFGSFAGAPVGMDVGANMMPNSVSSSNSFMPGSLPFTMPSFPPVPGADSSLLPPSSMDFMPVGANAGAAPMPSLPVFPFTSLVGGSSLFDTIPALTSAVSIQPRGLATCILTKKRKNWHGIPASCGIQMDAEEGIVESAAIGAAIKRAVASAKPLPIVDVIDELAIAAKVLMLTQRNPEFATRKQIQKKLDRNYDDMIGMADGCVLPPIVFEAFWYEPQPSENSEASGADQESNVPPLTQSKSSASSTIASDPSIDAVARAAAAAISLSADESANDSAAESATEGSGRRVRSYKKRRTLLPKSEQERAFKRLLASGMSESEANHVAFGLYCRRGQVDRIDQLARLPERIRKAEQRAQGPDATASEDQPTNEMELAQPSLPAIPETGEVDVAGEVDGAPVPDAPIDAELAPQDP